MVLFQCKGLRQGLQENDLKHRRGTAELAHVLELQWMNPTTLIPHPANNCHPPAGNTFFFRWLGLQLRPGHFCLYFLSAICG